MNLYSLTRCPVCRQQPSSRLGCCATCAALLFTPSVSKDLITLGRYGGDLEQAVRALKFHGATRLAQLFASELANLVKPADWSIDAVCAVPLHWRRYLNRGYNQADLIAKPLSKKLGVPYQRVLKRTRQTQQQARLSKADRASNVQDAFTASPVTGQQLLLIDDVLTSGATLAAARTALLEAGAKSVKLACVARA